MNVLAACTYFDVDISKLPKDVYEKIDNDYGGLEDEGAYIRMSEDNIDYYNVPSEAVDYSDGDFDEYELEAIMSDILGNYPHYLVFAAGCRWNGASGYKVVEDVKETCYRGYDITLELKERGKRKALFRESSHDVPMGSTTYMLGITEEEYDRILDMEFNEVEEFVDSIE